MKNMSSYEEDADSALYFCFNKLEISLSTSAPIELPCSHVSVLSCIHMHDSYAKIQSGKGLVDLQCFYYELRSVCSKIVVLQYLSVMQYRRVLYSQ
mmetsp:Transcript_5521/g.6797  ORF Transcript_5521/g.6797 Transcript_5521/m.6797 type:complete len:96 (-) Transcript_5521:394-681(-)